MQGALAAVLLGACASASAVLTIEVNKGVEAPIPIAIVPFAAEGIAAVAAAESPLADVIEADLARSGKFAPVARDDFLSMPHEPDAVRYKNWRLLKAEALVIGQVANLGDDHFEVQFRLLDVFREKQLAGQKFVVPAKRLRRSAHQISDIIHETLTGKPGAFDTRIAFVADEIVAGETPKRRYLLQIADADGHDPKTILESREIIVSPAWAPDGDWIAYVSYEHAPLITIYIQNLWSGERKRIADHPGLNSAPAWSPDGKRLALTLSKDGNTEIYIYHLATERLRRLTRNTAIDTEPAWSPDGGTIAFTSDRPGTPQIYRIAADGGAAQRVTFEGRYNAGASYSNDGKSIALITNQGNGFRVGLYSARDRTVIELTQTKQDESPTFAPNGEMIMYATQSGGRNVIATVSPDGRTQQILGLANGSVREPAWAPFKHNL